MKLKNIRKISKKTLDWITARKSLLKLYEKKGIRVCELGFKDCTFDYRLSFAHRFKRSDPRCRHTFRQTLKSCIPCHQKLEQDSDLTEKMFKLLRST